MSLLLGIVTSTSYAQYTPVKGDIIRTEVETTFDNLLEDSVRNPVPLILKVNAIRFMGHKTDYKFKSYECKTVAAAGLPKVEGDYEVRTPKAYLRLDSLICHKQVRNKDKYVINDQLKGWGLQNQVIGVMLNDSKGLNVGDKIDFFVSDKGVTTVYYRALGTDMDEEIKQKIDTSKE